MRRSGAFRFRCDPCWGENTVARTNLRPAEPVSPLEKVLVDVSLDRAAPRFYQRSPRLTLHRPVRFRAVDTHCSTVGMLRNISTGGAHICAASVPEPGTLIAFGFYVFHRGQRLMLRSMAQVVWVMPPHAGYCGFGVKFVAPPRTLLRTVEEMIQDRH